MDVARLMVADPVTVEARASLDEAIHLMDEHAIRHLPVVENGRFVGLISDRELLEATGWLPRRVREARQGSFAMTKPECVRDCMRAPAMTVQAGDDLLSLSVEWVVQGLGCLPVLRGHEVIGILTERDLLEAYLQARRVGQVAAPGCSRTVAEAMSRPARCLQRSASLGEARELCRRHAVRHLLVLDGERLAGILSDRDLRRAAGRGRTDAFPVDELMTAHPTTIAPSALLEQAAATLIGHHCSALPVLEKEAVVGILTVEDLIEPCLRELG